MRKELGVVEPEEKEGEEGGASEDEDEETKTAKEIESLSKKACEFLFSTC